MVIVSTDHPTNAISSYVPNGQQPRVQTQFIDDLAREGIKYNNALVTNSLPAPSNAALLTGKYCSNPANGVCTTEDVKYKWHDNTWTFVKELKESGYKTAIIGDYHLGDINEGWTDNYEIIQ